MDNELMDELAKVPKGMRYIDAPNFPKIHKLLREGTPYITPSLCQMDPTPHPASQNILEMETVHAIEGRFQIHPESYSPRVFCRVNDPSGKTYNVYELLRTGEAILWPYVPSGFDFWLIDVPTVSAINMKRFLRTATGAQLYFTPNIPEGVWDALRQAQAEAERLSGAPTFEVRGKTSPKDLSDAIPQADGDSGTLLDHLPEGSH